MSAARSEILPILRLAGPAMVTQVAAMMLGVVDTLMVGNVGVDTLAAASLGHIWILGTFIFGFGVVLGIDPIVAQGHGAKDARRVGLALQRGMIVAVLVSLPLFGVWLLAERGLLLFGQAPHLAKMAQLYVSVQMPSIPFFLFYFVFRQYLQGRGIMMPAMIVALVANGVNILLNWGLIYGHMGFEAMGLKGAGIATCSTRIFMSLAIFGLMMAGRLYRGGWTSFTMEAFRWNGLREVFRFGIPVGAQISLEVWAFQIAVLLAGRLGDASLAAHTICLNLASLAFMIPVGISFAAVTRVGNLIGAGKRTLAQQSAWTALGLSATIAGISAILFILLRNVFPRVYTPDLEVRALAASILPIVGAFQISDGIQVVGAGVLRGMGSTRPAAIFNFGGFYLIAMPLAWWMTFTLEWGLKGIWWGLAIGLSIVAVCLMIWIRVRGPAHSVSEGEPFPAAAESFSEDPESSRFRSA